MQEITQVQPHVPYPGKSPALDDGDWADSSVLYLLTCYDVWSATPPRGCEPAIVAPAAEAPPVS